MTLSIITLFLLPILVSSLITQYDQIQVNSASLIYQKYYMFDRLSSPSTNSIGNNQSYIEISFNVTNNIVANKGIGIVEAFIGSEEFFKNIGYNEGAKQVVCCDDKAFSNKNCTEVNHLIVPKSMTSSYVKQELVNKPSTIFLHYEIPVEGKYYMVVAMCNPATNNLNMTGFSTVMNPYGHIPARLYGLIPFSRLLVVAYLLLFCAWMRKCIAYRKELMSVHSMIFLVLVCFILDSIIRLYNLNLFNIKGSYITSLSLISLFFSTATRAIARCLAIMVCMGLGITRPNMNGQLRNIIVAGVIYFVFSLWDSISTTLTSSTSVNIWRLIPASLVDSIFYFWILQSLLDTIEELREKKQTSKLEVFMKLRNMIIVIVFLSTMYNIAFSWLVMEDVLESMWKYQWLFTDGIWGIFYFLILCSVILLWSPNERSLAYAYHVQVSTNELPDAEEPSMQDGVLQPADISNGMKVSTVDLASEYLKPMTM